MRLAIRLLPLLCALALPIPALATTFYLSGTLPNGGSAQGRIGIGVDGYVTTVDVSVFEGGNTFVFNQGSFFQQQYPNLTPPEFYSVSYQGNDSLLLAFPSLLVGYTGGPLCSLSHPCHGFPSSQFDNENFNGLTASLTPEPSQFSLLFLGLVGVAGAIRRRHARHRSRD